MSLTGTNLLALALSGPVGGTLTLGPDPRWGMQAPLPSSLALTTPGGLTSTLTTTGTVTLADPNNPGQA